MGKMKKNISNIEEISVVIIKCISLMFIFIVFLRHLISFDVNLSNLLVFLFFIVLFVQLQGISIIDLLKIRFSSISNKIVTGFFIGLAILFAEYFLSVLVRNNIVFFLGCGSAILFLLRNVSKQKKYYCTRSISIPAAYYVLLALLFVLSMIDVQLPFIRPELIDTSNVYQDYLYHMSLVNSISLEYPIKNPNIFGETIHYHFFSDLLCAIPVRLFGLTSKFVIIDCMPYLNTYIVSLSLYSLFRAFISNRNRSGVYAILSLFSFAGVPYLFNDYLLCHVVTNINAMGLGLSAVFCFLINHNEFETNRNQEGMQLKRIIVLCALAALLVGIKAPIGIVLIAALWGSYLIGFFFTKYSLNYSVLLLSVTLSGVLVYIIFVGADNGAGATFGLFFWEKVKALPLWDTADSILLKYNVPMQFRNVILMVLFAMFAFGVYSVLFIVAYIRELYLVTTNRKPYIISNVVIYAMIPIAAFIYVVVKFPDYYSSEEYFMFIALLFVPYVTFLFMEDLKEKTKWAWVLKNTFIICSCVGVVSMSFFVKSYSFTGIYNKQSDNFFDTITSAEYEGLCWIKDNTQRDSLLAIDRYQRVSPENYDYKIMHHNTFFGYSAYSQRNCYLGGSGYTLRSSRTDEIWKWLSNNQQLFDPLNEKRGDLARQIGIDYIVVSKRLYHQRSIENNDYLLCFSNKDIDIYRVVN